VLSELSTTQWRRMRERGNKSTYAYPRQLMRAPYWLILKMAPVNFAETLQNPQLSRQPSPESWSYISRSRCKNLTLPSTSAGLPSDQEAGSKIFFRNMLSQDMAGGGGKSMNSYQCSRCHTRYARHVDIPLLVSFTACVTIERDMSRYQSIFLCIRRQVFERRWSR
jgi:hypothetical protein